jgi:transcriptional regulator with XRE-family HTH domain
MDVGGRKRRMKARRQRLAQRRKAVGFSQEALAEQLDVDRSTIARWESGETEPHPWLRPRLARILRVSIDQVDELLVTAGPAETFADERLNYALDRPRSADLAAVAHLSERVREIDARYDLATSTSLLADTALCLERVSFLRAYAATNRVRRELYAVESEVATLMGKLVWDASQRRDHTTARNYFKQAIEAARELKDRNAEARALLRTSFVALYGEKDPRAGLTLAMRTAETAKHTSNVLAGLAILHAAEAHAMLAQRQECEQALKQAESHFERISRFDAALDLFSPTQHDRLAGSCYLSLDDPKRAEVILERTAEALRDRAKSQAIVLGNLALARLRQRRLDEAAAVLHRAIDVVERTWGGGGLTIIFGAGRELRQWRRIAAVQEVHDRLLALMAAG